MRAAGRDDSVPVTGVIWHDAPGLSMPVIGGLRLRTSKGVTILDSDEPGHDSFTACEASVHIPTDRGQAFSEFGEARSEKPLDHLFAFPSLPAPDEALIRVYIDR
ncbi:hypothetical protein JXA88_05270 [Candidatus Fermentibacteria bacterium]|nr:hypothetical protein [Candidatus Fermentibacteria bacterium]